ncbi:hypothetical protein DCS_04645 [Drechmeria coniospora]|uniref:Cyclin N-terminal domain-containing protein n=1 Tax=Drechmeria coniospora TaxID=98403 RepID=A0A151GKI9_DRECN|nr:hypothetical protein DCS_04645 [Drechmeria coniospora]KAH8836213.1 hypothetical protein RJ55_10087 [Drechmeria coniospora]KYK57633.1 hypothetical protein DCS_04645 [Drechmeria coniospora]
MLALGGDKRSERRVAKHSDAGHHKQLSSQPITRQMIKHIARVASRVMTCQSSISSSCFNPRQMPSKDRSDAIKRQDTSTTTVFIHDFPTLHDFIGHIVKACKVTAPALLAALVYMGRLKAKLQPGHWGLRCTPYRIFLASLILADKFLYDTAFKNKQWARFTMTYYAGHTFGFDIGDINVMEREMLKLLNWDLRVTDTDLYKELDHLAMPFWHREIWMELGSRLTIKAS